MPYYQLQNKYDKYMIWSEYCMVNMINIWYDISIIIRQF